jgi:hypothetical protein
MKSARADALRLILPLLLRLATVDFFGTDDLVVFVDDDREEWEDEWPPFCAQTCNGSRRARAARATPIRLSIYTPIPVGLRLWAFNALRQVKARLIFDERSDSYLLAVSRDGSRIFFPQPVESSEDSNVIHIR